VSQEDRAEINRDAIPSGCPQAPSCGRHLVEDQRPATCPRQLLIGFTNTVESLG
jgi:hypothetical protein